MNKREKIKEIKKLIPFEYGEFVIDLDSEGVFECKEEFINSLRDLPKAKDIIFIGKVEIEYINFIEELIGVPLSTVSFNETITWKDVNYDDYNCTKDFMQFRNKFWFKNHINLDAFCCIFKSLKDLKKGNKQSLENFVLNAIKKGDYFNEEVTFWSLLNIKSVPKFLGNPRNQRERLFNFDDYGLLSAVTRQFNKIKRNQDNEVVKQVKAVKSQYFS